MNVTSSAKRSAATRISRYAHSKPCAIRGKPLTPLSADECFSIIGLHELSHTKITDLTKAPLQTPNRDKHNETGMQEIFGLMRPGFTIYNTIIKIGAVYQFLKLLHRFKNKPQRHPFFRGIHRPLKITGTLAFLEK